MAVCSLTTLLSDSACIATLPPGTRSILKLQLLCNILNSESVADCDIQTLLDDASCFAAVPQGTRDILEVQLLCAIANGGGGSGNPEVTRGTGDPNGVVTGGTSAGQYLIYIQLDGCQAWNFGGTYGTNTGWC